jgi:methionyl-tRNA formyltransferase
MKQETNLKIVFLGTPEFGAIILEKLIKANFKPVLVVTSPDKPVGRKQTLTPPLVKVVAQKYKIPILQPEKILNLKPQISNLQPDLIVVAAYGQILPKEILDIPKYGSLNVHPSLLPKYRGSSPIQYAILNGDKETGVTIILLDEKIDHGDILAISNFESQISNLTSGELSKELANFGAELLVKTIPKWMKAEIKPRPQDNSKATYTKNFKKEDGKIDKLELLTLGQEHIRN